MRKFLLITSLIVFCLMTQTLVLGQEVPNDPNHLPQMIGGNIASNRVKVTGKVFVEGLNSSEEKPIIFVSVFSLGRFVEKQQVNANGSYTLNSVPRDDLNIVFEIDGFEVLRYQILPTISNIVYQDAKITILQIQKAKNSKATIISTNSIYQRTIENQKLFDQAMELSNQKKNSEAISILKNLITADKQDFIALTELGNLLFVQEKLNDAEAQYQLALIQNPKYFSALINLGKLFLIKKDGEKAIEVLTKAIELYQTSADANYYLGEAYLFIKKGSKAVGYLNEAIKLDPIGKADAHLRLAALYNGAGLKDKAAMEYKLFLEKKPQYKDKATLEKYIKENLPK